LDESSEIKLEKVKFSDENITILEKWIDQMDNELPKLTNFILPVNYFIKK
jgi:cob(I)alamin adenosyltransferase